MQTLKEKLMKLLISIITLPFRLIGRSLASLIRSILHRNQPEIAKKETSRSTHRNGQVSAVEPFEPNHNLVAETEQFIKDAEAGLLPAGITIETNIYFSHEQAQAELADFDSRWTKLNRSDGQKKAWVQRKEKQVQAEIERQRAEQERLAQMQKAQEKAKRSQSAQKGWQTRRNRQEDKQQ